MQAIQQRGRLVAGVSADTLLFGFRNPKTGNLEGIDIELVRRIAQAIFGDPDRVEYKVMTYAQRIPSLLDRSVDVVADVNPDSPTYGRHVAVTLSDRTRTQLWVPPGYAHGFVVVSDNAYFAYKCTEYYAPELERGVRWDDPTLAIEWPVEAPSLNTRDAAWPTLEEARREELPGLTALVRSIGRGIP